MTMLLMHISCLSVVSKATFFISYFTHQLPPSPPEKSVYEAKVSVSDLMLQESGPFWINISKWEDREQC